MDIDSTGIENNWMSSEVKRANQYQGALVGKTKRPCIFAHYNVLCAGLLHCGPKPQNYGLVLACFFLSCNPGASLSRVAFHVESEKHASSSAPL